ncbi:ABC transporter ATP-binding protein [Brucella anthropi]|jgi:multiple sugar transport system ATP-binding protein|uniref:sn-glycerol-3-phosphate ABC transporter ATP-binding protein UgpC n=1 Tax=Brucella anthropi TaxID=529 RepID=A0A6I0DSN2_BRUAN|nr:MULTISPECIES: sn-glycerol-3-phosphate ABC transporter ATP-binding protein UgpC [Brucella/Ochrobactrum group]MCR5939539.1 sn-glycerol-3-phosphate ABC transporter ATP-binding protein UgpC [Ochrobactrum sp. XJ1]QTN04714.1 sn-glycerol-3-phosphate ABC transporter ATP-binding protein UgpC [Ochrobactrum sp. EEELCW01]KAB2740587.1 sn-glycerol-3-phosphate ABC transporter ATP-binding protein UgpC [Brucella anthropi]KAB2757924.1 sn-glycerol-3-phosphate ABC transporter ATP-binding protein UgpC [Brucella 
MKEVSLRGITKTFGQLTVLDHVDLNIQSGEFLVLVGPSGCGKSTLLRMVAGLEPISGGDLLIGGERANELPPQKRNIAMVFQSYALFPHMTARENIGFGPRIRGEKSEETAAKVDRAASILNLHSYLDRYPRQLSGGQRQRVAMGRAIVREPSVFLFDEPLSNLDAQLRVQMRTEIKALHQRLKSTVIYVTHDQIEAMTMADRIVVMNQGRIQQIGAPLDLYDRPANKFVAGFIGSPSMSFIPGTVSDGVFRTGEGEEIAVGAGSSEIRQVEAGIRPENFTVAPDGKGLKLTVEVIEPTGPETHIYGRIAGQPIRAVFRERIHLAPGEQVPVTAKSEHIHLFDKDSGLPL